MPAPASDMPADDFVLPFRIEHVEASGRLARLGPAINDILSRHNYPDRVSEVLGEALLLVSLFGSMIKDRQTTVAASDNTKPQGSSERFILQTQTDGPLNLIVADYVHPGRLRGYARFDREAFEHPEALPDKQNLLGKGHLAMTIDRGADTDRYQGIVALEDRGANAGLCAAANLYFEQSEQLPTFIHLAIARHFDATQKADHEAADWHWRGGALMVQKLTSTGGHMTTAPVTDPAGGDEDDGWNRALILSQSVRDHELLDPLLAPHDLLFHLYHEDGVRVFTPLPMKAACSCSQSGVRQMLAGFSPADQRDMAEGDGKVHITCEFCNRSYALEPAD